MHAQTTGALSVTQFLKFASISRTKFYEEVTASRLETRKLGKKTLILRAEAERWLAALPTSREAGQ